MSDCDNNPLQSIDQERLLDDVTLWTDVILSGLLETLRDLEFFEEADTEIREHHNAEFHPDCAPKLIALVRRFASANQKDLNTYLAALPGHCSNDFSHIGHDIYLTACGHGTGFWDRGLGDVGERLTESCTRLFGWLEHAEKTVTYNGDHCIISL